MAEINFRFSSASTTAEDSLQQIVHSRHFLFRASMSKRNKCIECGDIKMGLMDIKIEIFDSFYFLLYIIHYKAIGIKSD